MADARQRLLIVTRNFPPLWGGMERLNWHMAEELARTYEVTVVGPSGSVDHAPEGVRVIEAPLRPLWRFLLTATWRAIRLARQQRPALVLAGSGLTAPIAWLAARASGARSAVYVHGLDLTVPHPLYRTAWHPALRRVDRVIANSSASARLAEQIGIARDRIAVVHPGVEIPELDPTARARFRSRHGLREGAPVLLSVGRLTTRKGLREFVSDVLPSIVSAHPDTVLLIVGDVPAHALFAQAQTPESIRQAAAAAGVDGNVRFLGTLFDQDLADAYAGADVHVFPVRDIPNDPEGFGMVAIEAASHGLPTAAYATGGVIDAVEDGVSGRLVPPDQPLQMASTVAQFLSSSADRDVVRQYASQFAWPTFGKALSSVLTERVP